ncbi:MAG: hypothetical protein WAQ52_15160 [Terriglobales bacterium]
MHFKIVGRIKDVEVIATGSALRERKRLWKIVREGPLEKAEREREHPIFGWYDVRS